MYAHLEVKYTIIIKKMGKMAFEIISYITKQIIYFRGFYSVYEF